MKRLFYFISAALIVVFLYVIYTQAGSYLFYRAEEEAVRAELAEEWAEYHKLERESEQQMSDAYVEKIAREMGLVHHDEIVFINDSAR